jgi:hypothetical protein
MASSPTTPLLSAVGVVVTPEDEVSSNSDATSTEGHEPALLSKAHVAYSPPAASRRFVPPEIDREKHNERKNTSVPIDGSRNIILPLDGLLTFLKENFSCRTCRVTVKPGMFDLDIFGLACGLNFNCNCGSAASLRSPIVDSSVEKIKTLEVGQPLGSRVNAGDFQINRRLLFGLQLSGMGRHDSMNLTGLLNLNARTMYMRWTEIQEVLAKAIIKVGKEVLNENLKIECDMSPEKEGRKALSVASDTRWDKKGSSRRYDSLSGCSVAFGLRSNLPIAIEPMSSICIKCTKKVTHGPEICPKNYEGSAKGMEATGAARIVARLFENEEVKCFVAMLVTDDDSSVRKILTHSYRELIDAGFKTDADWPRYKNGTGAKKPDNGLLPLLHAIILFLADKGHRVRGYASKLFVQANKNKKDRCGMTKLDAERMKRRLSWTLKLHCQGSYDEFKTAVRAVLEHHFGNHEYCADWCESAKGTEEEVSNKNLRFRNKDDFDGQLYLFLKTHHEEFMVDEKLRQLFHEYNTNAVEGFNKYLTKFLHKDKTFCQTIENGARSYLAAGLQSIGFRQFYERVFELTGIDCTDDDMTSLFFRSEDKDKLFRQKYRRMPINKRERMIKQYALIRTGMSNLVKENRNAMTYSTGMMGPGGEEEEGEQVRQAVGGPKKRKRRLRKEQTKPCKHCNSLEHARITSRECPKNKNYKGPLPMAINEALLEDPIVEALEGEFYMWRDIWIGYFL